MITPVKAWGLIAVGEDVYIHDGGVVACTVRNVELDHIVVDGGVLYYEDHGELWWLTEIVAKEKWKCKKSKSWC